MIQINVACRIWFNRGAVQVITASHDFEDDCSVVNGARNRSDYIGAARHCHDTGSAHEPIGGLIADGATKTGWQADRTTCVGAECKWCQVKHDCTRPDAGATAG